MPETKTQHKVARQAGVLCARYVGTIRRPAQNQVV